MTDQRDWVSEFTAFTLKSKERGHVSSPVIVALDPLKEALIEPCGMVTQPLGNRTRMRYEVAPVTSAQSSVAPEAPVVIPLSCVGLSSGVGSAVGTGVGSAVGTGVGSAVGRVLARLWEREWARLWARVLARGWV